MSIYRMSYPLLLVFLLSGCSDTDTPPAAETVDAATASASEKADMAATEPSSVDDNSVDDSALLKRGKIVFLRCRSCHSTEKDAAHLTGPNLNGLFGAKAGTKSGYPFSPALSSSDIIWTAESLDEWIEQPSDYIPQNRMVFAGIPGEEDRAALIAFLAEVTR